jgi:hypothetical protein
MDTKIGHIPETIAYIFNTGKPLKITRGFDDIEEGRFSEIVYSTFPSDAANQKTVETGLQWATMGKIVRIGKILTKDEISNIIVNKYNKTFNGIPVYDHRYYIINDKNELEISSNEHNKLVINIDVPNPLFKDPTITTHFNNPITNIRVAGLETRGNGGRAYKVVIDDLYYFDLREDVLLEAMIECGINKGGILNGEYIWVKIRSHMKLIRVGSPLHKEMIKANIAYHKKHKK